MTFLAGYKTLALNIATFIILLGGAFSGTITDTLTLQIIAIAMTVANVVLRFLTSTPVLSGKDSP